ncbi:hypothetical protein GCM10027090_27170 [Sinomonas soli]
MQEPSYEGQIVERVVAIPSWYPQLYPQQPTAKFSSDHRDIHSSSTEYLWSRQQRARPSQLAAACVARPESAHTPDIKRHRCPTLRNRQKWERFRIVRPHVVLDLCL